MCLRHKEDFFIKPAVEVAQNLLGQTLVFYKYKGIITETECYRGADDPASHAYRGMTERTRVMFDKPGLSYVYLIYGMYHCLNIVTEPVNSPSAILIRGLKLLEPYTTVLDGPGKLCRVLNITKEHNYIDLTNHTDFYILPGKKIPKFISTTRVGIKNGFDKKWRFYIPNNDL